MKNYLALFSLGLGLFLTGCQSDVTSENPQEVNEFQNSKKEVKHDANKLHMPPLVGTGEAIDGFKLHEPGFFQGALANCDSYHHYNGGEKLIVTEDASQSYHGEIDVKTIDIHNQLNICGTLSVRKDVKVNYSGVFNLGGEMITEGDVKITYGGHLVVEGNVIVGGDFVLAKGATLEFLGSNSTIEIQGKAKIHNEAIITGTFNDASNKLN
ncbi:MAG: hypothetical protein KJP01_02070 [Gramella sp.]|nr:hypothetical protein [Christiangramia sp.]